MLIHAYRCIYQATGKSLIKFSAPSAPLIVIVDNPRGCLSAWTTYRFALDRKSIANCLSSGVAYKQGLFPGGEGGICSDVLQS